MSPPSPDPAPGSSFEFDALRLANNYRRALLREFGAHLTGAVIEVGAGIGQMTELLRQKPDIQQLIAIEPSADFCRQLGHQMPDLTIIQGTVAALDRRAAADAILSVNVLEHIRDDALELQHYAELLRDRQGCLCLFTPARQEIYAPLDQDFGHFRRYSKPALRRILEQAGFTVARLHYYNFVGYFAWWFSFCLLRKRQFDPGAVKLFDRAIFPVTYWLESRLCWPPFGQNLMAVAKSLKQAA